MSEQYTGQLSEVSMTEAWKQWEGQTVNGEFHLVGYLGGSDHSAVFQTEYNPRDPQKAAIKLIAEDSIDAESRLASWQIASTLSHPNLIQILQMGRCQIGDAKLLYVVMEFAEEDLAQIVPQRPLIEHEASEMLKPALDALAYLHARGLVHGHIKPSNVMACGDQLKLSPDRIRRDGEPIRGRDGYDPPESIRTAAGDVWSIGMTLVEVLTQHLPAWDESVAGEPPVKETAASPLLDIAQHCLRRDPKLRWTLGNIANRLQTPVAQLRPEQSAQAHRPRMRSGYLIVAAILILGLAYLISAKLQNRFSRTDAALSQSPLKTSAEALPGPQKLGNDVVPPEEKAATPSEKQVSGGTLQAHPAIRPPESSPLPGASAESGIVNQVLPDVPQKARDTIRGTVRVGIAVTVDASGNVIDAAIDSPGPSVYFANLARRAAQQWKFMPSGDGSNHWTLRFAFAAGGTTVSAKHSSS